MEYLLSRILQLQVKLRSLDQFLRLVYLRQKFIAHIIEVKSIGNSTALSDYEKRKLGVFNLINYLQILIGVAVPITFILGHEKLSTFAWLIASMPVLVSVFSMYLNHRQKYDEAHLAYFILYPFFTSIVYLNGLNLGVDLYFILYGVLAVFFMKDFGYMLFTIAFSMVSYYVLSVLWADYQYRVASSNIGVFRLNQAIAILFIYWGLFLIKKENNDFQFRLMRKNRSLLQKNREINQQQIELGEKAKLLEEQKEQLAAMNIVKSKLFSVISHDLKSPMYALRNLFNNVQKYDIPAQEVKKMVPEAIQDINYTIGLMENLLQWSKSQMENITARTGIVDLTKLIEDNIQLLRLQAEAKQIDIHHRNEGSVFVKADKDMVDLVIRNLLSNAIKFTPQCGSINIGVQEMNSFCEVFIQDTGVGMTKEILKKINSNSYFTSKGTASEGGTGLGLMLCREFLAKNDGQLHIESTKGEGSTFSFTLPAPDYVLDE